MLRKIIRALGLTLLLLAVPVQGFAAVSAGICMALGHHQDGSGNQGHAHDGDLGDHYGDGHDQDGKKSHCGPCAACCAGSASIAAAAILPILAEPSSSKYVLSQLPPRGAQPHGLDRPPLPL